MYKAQVNSEVVPAKPADKSLNVYVNRRIQEWLMGACVLTPIYMDGYKPLKEEEPVFEVVPGDKPPQQVPVEKPRDLRLK